MVDAGGRFVDRDAVLAELHPPLERVACESPSHPAQRAARASWEAWRAHRAEADRRRRARDAEIEAEADAIIAAQAEGRRWVAGDRIDRTLAAYAAEHSQPDALADGRRR